jgi:5'-nucleotidase / UDP-sugar diphosphatase
MKLRNLIASSKSAKKPAHQLLLFSLLCLIVPLLVSCDNGAAARPHTLDLVILHTNDIHGQVLPRADRRRGPDAMTGGFVALAQLIREERRKAKAEGKEVLLLDGGDQFQGTPEGNITRGKIVTDFMNAVKYDACVIGNHEYDFGQQIPKSIAKRLKASFLGANVVEHDSGRVATYLQSHTRTTIRGLPVVIVGLTTSSMKRVTMAGVTKGLRFPKEETTLKKIFGELKLSKKGQALTILLSHIGQDRDEDLAKKFPVLDVIIGGHSHTPIQNPTRQGPGQTLVTQAWDKTKVLGRVDIRIDLKTRKVISMKGRLIPVHADKLGKAQDVVNILKTYTPQIEAQMGELLGTATADFTRSRVRRSSSLGNFVTDAMREVSGAQIAFQNKPGIRSDLPGGKVTLRSVYEVSPFGNTLVTMTLTGKQVQAIMENSLNSDHSFLEISGMTCLCDSRKKQKVIKITVGGKDLDPSAGYTVVTNSYIAKGGDGANVFKQGTNVVDTRMPLRMAQRTVIKRMGQVKPNPEFRLNDLALPKQ